MFRLIVSLFPILIFSMLMNSCNNENSPKVDWQGHRGARGLMPENTLPAFEKALELGVNTLELDLAVSADSQLVVSHEPWFNAAISLDPEGNPIPESEEKLHNIFQMPYEMVARYDCGSLGNPRFPEQQKMKAYKPLLREVVEKMEAMAVEKGLPLPDYNIEIKSSPEGDGRFHPMPAAFSELLVNFLEEKHLKERVTVQSFDFRVLQYLHVKHPDYTLAMLVENEQSIEENLAALGFTPAIYSPYFKFLTADSVQFIHNKGMKVIPWTVNKVTDMRQLINWGVDGIITDYPNRALLKNE